jgi:hypothetical protein
MDVIMGEGMSDRMLFFQKMNSLLERERSEFVSDKEIDDFVSSLSPTVNYPINILLEDFVECASLRTLERVHSLFEKHPLVMDSAEATKMGVLKIFNLFSRRQSEGIGAEDMAKFILLVSGSVSISDRSGVNLKGEKNGVHLKVTGEDFSPLVKSVYELQRLLYSESGHFNTGNVAKLITDICALIAPSLIESDNLINDGMCLPSSPYFQIYSVAKTVDVSSAILILVQCLILIDSIENNDIKQLKTQVVDLMNSTMMGKLVVQLYPFLAESDRRWTRWKRDEMCKDVYKPPVSIQVDSQYYTHVPEVAFPIQPVQACHLANGTSIVIHDVQSIQLSEWAINRQKAFGNK